MKTKEVQIDVARREVIKPDSKSPRDHVQLSSMDLIMPGMYVSTIFFYNAKDLITVSAEIFSANLKDSLSKTLSSFYPLAGQIEGTFISCNGKGAVFTEARTDLLLPDLLRNSNTYSLQGFLPTLSPKDSPSEWSLLSVKLTFHGSGSGVVVSISVSHKICDAALMVTFAKVWATIMVKGKSNDVAVTSIKFAETTIYPSPHPSIQLKPMDFSSNIEKKCAIKRLVFEPSKIAELKQKATSKSILAPTQVEAISSLIWRCARNASHFDLAVPRSMVMYQAMDLRQRIPTTLLPQNAIGNLITMFYLKMDAEDKLEIPDCVAAFRKNKEGVIKDIDNYGIISWCRKPFYEVDFGFGGLVWIGLASQTIYENKEGVMLIDSKDGNGVEAWISLHERDMSVFVRDQELLTYAVLDPPVLI